MGQGGSGGGNAAAVKGQPGHAATEGSLGIGADYAAGVGLAAGRQRGYQVYQTPVGGILNRARQVAPAQAVDKVKEMRFHRSINHNLSDPKNAIVGCSGQRGCEVEA